MDPLIPEMFAKVDLNSNELENETHNERVKHLCPMKLKIMLNRNEANIEAPDSWDGLQTSRDRMKSQHFINSLRIRGAIVCPNCRTLDLQKIGAHLVCGSCNLHFNTNLSVNQIIDQMNKIIFNHSTTGCKDSFPQLDMFQSNLVIYCDNCPFYHFVL